MAYQQKLKHKSSEYDPNSEERKQCEHCKACNEKYLSTQKSLAAKTKQLKAKEIECNAALKEKARCKSLNDKFQQKLKESRVNESKLQLQYKTKLEQKDETIKAMRQDQYESVHKEVNEHRSKIEEYKRETKKLENECKAKQQEIKDVKKEHRALLDAKQEQYNEIIRTLHEQLQSAQTETQQYVDKEEVLKQQIEGLQQELESQTIKQSETQRQCKEVSVMYTKLLDTYCNDMIEVGSKQQIMNKPMSMNQMFKDAFEGSIVADHI